LHERARANLRELRLPNLRLVCGDGSLGVPAAAPYAAIASAAAGDAVPAPWIEQLAAGGRIVAPVGSTEQSLEVISKDSEGRVARRKVEAVRFVPLRGGVQ
jgi:protein-L-isoaspartate(D-aspartate) O-methyltransferase